MNILVIGDICLDSYYHVNVRDYNPEGDFPICTVVKQEHKGGMALNVANSLKKLGHDVICISNSTEPKTHKIRVVDYNTQDVLERLDINDYEGDLLVNEEITNVMKFFKPDAVIISDYAYGTIKDFVLSHLNKYIENIPVYIDPKSYKLEFYLKALSRAKKIIFSPNRKEAQWLLAEKETGSDFLIVKSMLEYTKKYKNLYFLFKRSEHGLIYVDNNYDFIEYSLKSKEEIVDVCGAGDVALAAFVHAQLVSPSNTPNSWLKFANAAASVKLEHLGNYNPSLEEILTEVKKYEFKKRD